MTKRQDLCLQRRSRPEQSDQRQPDHAANISYQPKASPDSTSLASRIEFPTMTAGHYDEFRVRVDLPRRSGCAGPDHRPIHASAQEVRSAIAEEARTHHATHQPPRLRSQRLYHCHVCDCWAERTGTTCATVTCNVILS